MNQAAKTNDIGNAFLFSVIFVSFLFIFGICYYFSDASITNLTIDKYILKCKAVSWEQKNDKTNCEEFELAYINTEKVRDVKNSKNKELFTFINQHCIKFDDKHNCQSVVLNFTNSEVKGIYSRKKKVNIDFLGNVELTKL